MNKKAPPPPPPDDPMDEMPPADFMPVPPNANTYVQVAFWLAQHVRNQAERSQYSEDQLIEQFAQNVRKINNPDWRADA